MPPTPPAIIEPNAPLEPASEPAAEALPDPDALTAPEFTPGWPGAATGLFVLGCLYTLHFAQAFLIPLVVAGLVALILAPIVSALMRIHVPRMAAAGLVTLALVGLTGLAVQTLSEPALDLIERAPQTLQKVKRRLGSVSGGPLHKVSEVTDTVSHLASPGRRLKVETTSLQEELLSQLTTFASSLVVILILIFFMLATGKDLLRKLVVLTHVFSTKKRVVSMVHQLGIDVSRYLVTITAINLALGCVVAVAMYFSGMPTPLLWGCLAFIFNYVPYLGAIVAVVLLAAVSLVTFPTLSGALLPPALYLIVNTFEGMVVTPSILGRRLPVGPLALMVGLVFWGWIWGVVGAFVAVPVMAATKLVCDGFDRSRWLGSLLGGETTEDEAP